MESVPTTSAPTITEENFDFEAWTILEDLRIFGSFGNNFKANGCHEYDKLVKVTEHDLEEMQCDDTFLKRDLLLAIEKLRKGLPSVVYGLLSARLYLACGKGDLAAVKELEAQGGNLNWRTTSRTYGYTTLHQAAKGDHVDVIKYLLDNGAHINDCSNIYCHTPLSCAARSGCAKAVKFLYENGAYVHKTSSRDEVPLSGPIFFNKMHIVQYMLELPEVNINATDQDGESVLHDVGSIQLPMLKLLVNAGAKMFSNKKGKTPVHKAAECNQTDLSYRTRIEAIVYMVKEGGADVNAVCQSQVWHVQGNTYTQSKFDEELTALHIAARRGNLEMVQTLVQLGAHIKRLSGNTPMDLAEQKGHTEVLEYLNSLPEVIELLEKEKEEAEKQAEQRAAERERLRLAEEEENKKKPRIMRQWIPFINRHKRTIFLLFLLGITYLLRRY